MIKQVLSMDEPKQKLAKLEEFVPNQPCSVFYDFGHYLATRLNPELIPEGFVMGCELALYDLQMGMDGFTGKPIQNKLVGYPPIIYDLLRVRIPLIADAIFPVDFATSVKIYINEINAEMAKKQTEK